MAFRFAKNSPFLYTLSMSTNASHNNGQEYLKSRLAALPTSPGVYRMLNDKGELLYVGKAKNIKNRVTQYTNDARLTRRIAQMVFHTRELIVVETTTEAEALLLEIQLIQSLKPKYNIIFRDDSTYLKIVITDDPAPQIRSHRGKAKPKGQAFGPYPNGDAVYRTIDLLERLFQLRTCKPSQFANRTRPCLKYDIKRCSAPCVNKITPEDYAASVQAAAHFLNGKTQDVQHHLTHKMQTAAKNEEFEAAAHYRDQLSSLSSVLNTKQGLAAELSNADVLALAMQPSPNGHLMACIQIFHYRNGQSFGNSVRYQPLPEGTTPKEALETFLLQHYTTHTPPKNLLITPAISNSAALSEALSTKAQNKVTIASPTRGEKHQHLAQAQQNATNTLTRKLAETANWQTQMQAFGEHLNLPEIPHRVECFDVSNISGKHAVTSMVVADTEGMQNKQYRLFNASTNTPDDYAMMAETLTRRYAKLMKSEETTLPAIIMVDGGIGHLNTAIEACKKIGLLGHYRCPALTAIAKGEERNKGLEKIYLYNPKTEDIDQLPIPHDTPLIFMLQQIRDEAHRFAIGAHRKKRGKTTHSSGLDNLPNVGAKRKKALLLHFGSLDSIKSAPPQEIAKVNGISKNLADDIHAFFNG